MYGKQTRALSFVLLLMFAILTVTACGSDVENHGDYLDSYYTELDRMNEILDFFNDQLNYELAAISRHIPSHSDGEARLLIMLSGRQQGLIDGRYEDDYFYVIRQGESWPERIVTWNFFYIREDFSEIFWWAAAAEDALTLEEWRESDFYPNWLWEMEYQTRDLPPIYTVTMRIHENMEEFTFRHMLVECEICAVCVSIVIEDKEGNLIQELLCLPYGSSSPMEFADYNFDGYLDMTLLIDPGRMQIKYYWLWDAEKGLFVFNEQLSAGGFGNVFVDEEARRLRFSVGAGSGDLFVSYFYYLNGDFVHTTDELYMNRADRDYSGITRTDIRTGKITDIFTTTARIHHNMPEFTFHRIVGGYIDDNAQSWYDFLPTAREVSIIIEDESGNIIQIISNLTQSTMGWGTGSNIEFDDFNFDGYLDMRLFRWQNSAGGLFTKKYYWLWDTENSQFVLNEQLIEIGHAPHVYLDQDARQVVAVSRFVNRLDGGASNTVDFYEYHNGEFILVAHEYHRIYIDRELSQGYWEITRTDKLTSEVTIEIIPTDGYGNPIDDD